MSFAARTAPERATDARPRCSMETARHPLKAFCGRVRAPVHADELGAVNVLEPIFSTGKRIAFFRIDADQAEVRILGPPPPLGPPLKGV